MSDKNHLLILGAAPRDAEAAGERLLLAGTAPTLATLLAGMEPEGALELPPDSPSMPGEAAVAKLLGLPAEPGHIPWAALDTGTAGTPCAWIRPCFWQVGVDHVMPADPDALDLDEPSSRVFLAAMAPYFAEDGIVLEYRAPTQWLATGEIFRGLLSVSLDRVIGRRITPSDFGGPGPEGAKLRRLQNEMQMLLYTHRANEERQAAGRLPLNSFWVTGAGRLETVPAIPPGLEVDASLRPPWLAGDTAAHRAGWKALDGKLAALLARQQRGEPVRLTLCGERRAVTWRTARPRTLLRNLRGLFSRGPGHDAVLETL